MSPVPPGSTIGMLGGGQLGRMAALAAARLGYRVHVYAPPGDNPACAVAAAATLAPWDDPVALHLFAEAVDVVTLEFENVPLAALERLARRVPVRPGAAVLAVAQDRVAEKGFANRIGLATARWRVANGPGELGAAVASLGGTAIAKTTRLGYDGKGQRRLDGPAAAAAAWAALVPAEAHPQLIVEEIVPFRAELSVVAARGFDGAFAAWPAVENRHCDHILAETTAPAAIAPALAAEATAIARRLAEALDYVGTFAVELFLTADDRLLFNEMAPRPHNSGHWTLDAAVTDQFEQQIRAVCGLPLGSTRLKAGALMRNLLGADAAGWRDILADPEARLHLYGKTEARPGRKMGHVTWLRPLPPGA